MTTARELLVFFGMVAGLGILCGIGIAGAFYREKIDRLNRRIEMLKAFPHIENGDGFLPVRPMFLPKARRRM